MIKRGSIFDWKWLNSEAMEWKIKSKLKINFDSKIVSKQFNFIQMIYNYLIIG